MTISSKCLFFSCIVMMAYTSCKSNVSVGQKGMSTIDYNQLLCIILVSTYHYTNDWKERFSCISLNPELKTFNSKVPFRVTQNGFEVTNGKYAPDHFLNENTVLCDGQELPIHYSKSRAAYLSVDEYCNNFILQLTQPYFITDHKIYLPYSFDCGVQCGEGFYAVIDISNKQYELLLLKFDYID